MIDAKNKVVFIHIPRTNGSEFCNQYYNTILHEHIDEVFYDKYVVGKGNAHKHFTLVDYKQFYYGEDIDDYNQMCIIRNIFDLVVSTFFQLIHNNVKFNGYQNWSKINNKQFTLDNWIDYLYVLRERPRAQNKSPYESLLQSEFLAGCSEACVVVSYEEYEAQINLWFEETFQKTVSIPLFDDKQLATRYTDTYRGVYRPVDFRDVYTDDIASRVEDLFADEVDMFDFKL
jgi:hypothetical protein